MGGIPFSNLQQMELLEEIRAICLEQTEIQFQCLKHLYGNVVLLLLALYHTFKSMEQLPFDSPAKTDVVRRFLSTANVFVSTQARI